MQRALLVILLGLGVIIAPAACAEKAVFGTTAGGEQIFIYTLTNGGGMEARVSNYGAILVSLKVPDRDGRLADIVLGFSTLDEYLKHRRFGGTIAGRHAGRLSGGRITLNGIEYELARNEGQDNVHGGANGFDTRVWRSRDVSNAGEQRVELTYLSKDGEEGFPGNLQATVVYSLTGNNELRLEFSATTDKDTVVNPMNHAYLNLAGEGEGDILGHVLTIYADQYSPLDANRVTTGKLESVEGTPFDFRKPASIGSRINQDHEQLRIGSGFDHHFILRDSGGKLALAARVYEPKSGRVMEVLTTETSALLYTGQKLNGKTIGKRGKPYERSSAFALEVQHMPDAPSKPWLPSTVLAAGDRYQQTTVFRCSID